MPFFRILASERRFLGRMNNIKKILILFSFLAFFISARGQNTPFAINNSVMYTKDKNVTLSFTVPRAKEMLISNTDDFKQAKWEPYNTKKTGWVLEEEDGEKVVYAKFKDAAGNESSPISTKIILDRTKPSITSITVNENRSVVNFKTVLLKVSAEGSSYISISNKATFQGAGWYKYTDTLRWVLDEPDGEKTIYVKCKDDAGNSSDIASTKIILDRIAPTPVGIKINNGSKYTTTKSVELALSAPGATEIMIKQKKSIWEPYTAKKEFTLEGEDGIKTIYLRFKDAAGNASETVSASIVLDQQAPQNTSVVINKGNEWTANKERKVALILNAEGASEMMLSNDVDFKNATWEKYTKDKIWVLSSEEGKKIVYAKFKDAAGNVSETIHDDIQLDLTAPKEGKLHINNDASITNVRHVVLKIEVQDASDMIISNSASFTGAKWESYTTQKSDWLLTPGNGMRTVYARFKDLAGNISDLSYATIALDTIPPSETSIKIDGGKEWTTSADRKVNLTLNAKDAIEMTVSDHPEFSKAKWEPYASTKTFTLTSGDGVKTIGVKFKDPAGNISLPVIAKIKLKQKGPSSYRLSINQDSVYTKTTSVNLYLTVDYASEMLISSTADFINAKWEPYVSKKPWKLDGADGLKTVYVKWRDPAGNTTDAITDDIQLDRIAPKNCKLLIDKDSAATNNPKKKVQLTIVAEEADQMVISNTEKFSDAKWEPFKTTKDWTLDGNDGVKTVYAQFKDKAGNLSPIVKDQILLDFQPPADITIKINNGASVTSRREVTLLINAPDAKYISVSNSSKFSSKSLWEKFTIKQFKKWILDGNDGEKTVYVQVKDAAGNTSGVVNAKITLDTKPPVGGSFKINNDSTCTNRKDKKVNLSIDAKDAMYMLISTNRLFKGVDWENAKKTRPFIVDGEDGTKTIYMLFKDEAGNISTDTLSQQIVVDRMPPKVINIKPSITEKTASGKKVTLTFQANDAAWMMLSNTTDFKNATWETYTATKEWMASGETIYLKLKDACNNTTSVILISLSVQKK